MFRSDAADNCNLLHSFLHTLYYMMRFSVLWWKKQPKHVLFVDKIRRTHLQLQWVKSR